MPRQKSTHVDSPAAVGERLKLAREKAGLSQRQLSFPGCSPAYISRIESGDRIPSLQLLRELGRRLGVTEDYLATGAASRDEGAAVLVEAEVELRLGNLEEAERIYGAALEGSPNSGVRGGALAGLGTFGDGEPAHPELADSLGRAYAMVGELESAIGVFERCLTHAEQRDDL